MVKYKPVKLTPDGERLALAGKLNLEDLLRNMSPVVSEDDYVFCTVENSEYGDFAESRPLACFAESEGLTLVLVKDLAEKLDFSFDGVFRCITLGVHSSLGAVGLTAAVTGQLAAHGIAANVIAAYFHDHVFVPAELADPAIDILSGFNSDHVY